MDKLKIAVSKTLYHNTYRCTITTSKDDVIGLLRIVPGLPIDRSLLPEDAPEVPDFLLVIVDDADITSESLLNFEERVSVSLLERFSTETTKFKYCQFYYPSPAFIFSDQNLQQPLTN